jgi:hypothetical protein
MTSYKVIADINRNFVCETAVNAFLFFVLVMMEVVIVYCHVSSHFTVRIV